MAYTSFTSFVRKNPATTLAATVALAAAGVFFVTRAPVTGLAPTGTVVIHRYETGSGVQVGAIYDSGKAAFTGAIITDASFSGATTFTLDAAGDRKNKIACWGTGGTIGYCGTDNGADDCGCIVP